MIDRIVNVAAVLVVAAAALFFAKAWFASDGVPGVGLVNLGEEEFGLPAEFVRAASTGHRLGPEDAPVVLLLYSDYACGFCREFDRTLRVVRRRYPQHLAVAVKPFVPLEMNESTRLFLGAEWHRFTVNLLGRTPAQLPTVPLSFWIREAVKAVFLAAAGARGVPAVEKRRAK